MTDLLLFALPSVLLMAISQLVFKAAASKLETSGTSGSVRLIRMLRHPWVITALGLNVLAAISWLFALSRLELSYAFPLLSLNYILIPVAARWIFDERISVVRAASIGVIAVGVVMCVFSG